MKLCKEIEVLIWKFWWGQNGDRRSTYSARCEKYFWPKELGGLGSAKIQRCTPSYTSVAPIFSIILIIYYTRFSKQSISLKVTFWNCIFKIRYVIQDKTLWTIGDHIWKDRWLPQPNNHWVISPVPHTHTE